MQSGANLQWLSDNGYNYLKIYILEFFFSNSSSAWYSRVQAPSCLMIRVERAQVLLTWELSWTKHWTFLNKCVGSAGEWIVIFFMAKLCWPEMRWYSEDLLLTANYSHIYPFLTYCVPLLVLLVLKKLQTGQEIYYQILLF